MVQTCFSGTGPRPISRDCGENRLWCRIVLRGHGVFNFFNGDEQWGFRLENWQQTREREMSAADLFDASVPFPLGLRVRFPKEILYIFLERFKGVGIRCNVYQDSC